MGFEKFFKNKKAVIKISSIILSLIAVTFLILFASGVFAGTHSSIVTISPLIVPNASSVQFNANVLWTGGPDPIHEFRVYQPLEFSGLNCYSVFGWYEPFYAYTTINGTEYYYCQWNAKSGNQLNEGNPEKDFIFSLNTAETESCRDLYTETRDDDGMYVPHKPQICVDTSPPITRKSFIGPYKYGSGPEEWIDGITEIKLDAVDPPPHPSGVDKTWYMNVIDLTEDACWNPEKYCNPITEWPSQYLNGYSPRDKIECIDSAQEWCSDEMSHEPYTDDWYDCVEDYAYNKCEVDPLWKLYRGVPIKKNEESCHLLQFFSVDNVGSIEDYKVNCFFVDLIPPEVRKDNGQAIQDSDIDEFPLITDGIFHWITPDMPITFTCTDQQPHPSGDEELCFKVSYDNDPDGYNTDEYCNKYQGEMTDEDYCCVAVNPDKQFIFNFNENEDSIHDLEYYCEDAVEKKSDVHLQYYKVDSTPPIITK